MVINPYRSGKNCRSESQSNDLIEPEDVFYVEEFHLRNQREAVY